MVKRYFITEKLYRAEMAESPIGAYVEWADYAALESRIAALEAQLAREQTSVNELSLHSQELEAERDQLKAAIATPELYAGIILDVVAEEREKLSLKILNSALRMRGSKRR